MITTKETTLTIDKQIQTLLQNSTLASKYSFRIVTPQDGADILACIKGNVRERFAKFESLEETIDWINLASQEIQLQQRLEFVIRQKRDNLFLGMVSIRHLNSLPEYGIWINEDHQAKGLGGIGIYAISEYIWNFTNIKQIIYSAETDNLPSLRLAQKCGFTKIGFTRQEGIPVNVFAHLRPEQYLYKLI